MTLKIGRSGACGVLGPSLKPIERRVRVLLVNLGSYIINYLLSFLLRSMFIFEIIVNIIKVEVLPSCRQFNLGKRIVPLIFVNFYGLV